MEPTVKPGTRCEGAKHNPPNCQCPNDAARMVTVPTRAPEYYARVVADVRATLTASDWKQVPMCEACAAWHEAKGAK